MKGGHVASTDFFVLKQCLSELFSFNQHHLINLMQKKSYSICSQVRWKYLQITVFLATRKQSNSFAIYYFWYFYLFLLEFNHFLSSSFIKKKRKKEKMKKRQKISHLQAILAACQLRLQDHAPGKHILPTSTLWRILLKLHL